LSKSLSAIEAIGGVRVGKLSRAAYMLSASSYLLQQQHLCGIEEKKGLPFGVLAKAAAAAGLPSTAVAKLLKRLLLRSNNTAS